VREEAAERGCERLQCRGSGADAVATCSIGEGGERESGLDGRGGGGGAPLKGASLFGHRVPTSIALDVM
jgi:hypothetical protein